MLEIKACKNCPHFEREEDSVSPFGVCGIRDKACHKDQVECITRWTVRVLVHEYKELNKKYKALVNTP